MKWRLKERVKVKRKMVSKTCKILWDTKVKDLTNQIYFVTVQPMKYQATSTQNK